MIEYSFFDYKYHPLTYSANQLCNLPEDIISILKEWDVEFSDKVIIAEENNNLIGFFRYDLGDIMPWLYDAGTYVIPEYRNQNIAFNLWSKAIQLEMPSKILAYVISDDGLKLLRRIQKEFPRILYDYSLDKKVSAA
jgi:hypothetical protein